MPAHEEPSPPESTETLLSPFVPLMDAATDGLYILDADARLVLASRSFARMLGYAPPDLLGLPVSRWNAGFDTDELARKFSEVLALPSGKSLLFESVHRKKDGSLFPVEIHASSILLGGRRFAFNSSRDISRRKNAERHIRRLSGFNALLARANLAVAEANDEAALFQALCEAAVSAGDLCLAWIGVPEEDGTFRILARSGPASEYLDSVKIPADPEKSGILSLSWRAFVSGSPLFNQDLGRFVREGPPSLAGIFREAVGTWGVRSFAALPVTVDGRSRALFALYHRETEAFDPELAAVLEEVARSASLGLAHIDVRQKELRSRVLREALLDNTLAGILLLKDLSIVEANGRVAEMLGYGSPDELVGRSTRIFFLDPAEFDHVEKILVPGLSFDEPLAVGEMRLVRKDGSPLWIDASASAVRIGDESLVVVTLHDVTLRRQQDLRLSRLSDFTALLARANRILADSAKTSDVARLICETAGNLPGALFASLESFRADGSLERLASSDLSGNFFGGSVSAGEAMVISQGEPRYARICGPTLRENSLPSDSSWGDALPAGEAALASLPLHRQGAPWGLFRLFHRDPDVFVDPEIRTLLEELAGNVSRSLDRIATTERERLLSTALACVSDGATVTDAKGFVLYANSAFFRITGFSPEEVIGKNLRLLQGSGTDPETVSRIGQAVRKAEEFHGQILNFKKDGTPFWNLMTISPIRDTSGAVAHFVGVQRDISEIRNLSDQLEYQAFHDLLTGLPNRRSLEIHLSRALVRARRNGTITAVGILDLDDFKPVNDTYGHPAGDLLLREFADRARGTLRDNDFLARLGGDEFVVVIEDLDPQSFAPSLSAMLSRLHRSVEIPFDLGSGREGKVGMTLGLALFPADGQNGDELIRIADAAMYQAKERKTRGGSWWQRGPLSGGVPGPEEPFDPYGPHAAVLLDENREPLRRLLDRFVRDFYDRLSGDPEAEKILSSLSPDELSVLRIRQAEHLLFLLDPETTRQAVLERAERTGETHALVGLDFSLILQSKTLYSNLLVEHLTKSRLSPRDRYRIYLAADSRLQDDIREEVRTGTSVRGAYFDLLSLPLPQAGALWLDAARREIENMASLPGIRCTLLLRPDAQGTFQVEGRAGICATEAGLMMGSPGSEPVVDPSDPRGRGIAPEAFRTLQISVSRSACGDPGLLPWQDAIKKLGIRSGLAIPAVNASGQAVAVAVLFGGYPNQFSSSWTSQFAQSLRHRLEQVWSLCNAPVEVISREEAEEYRKELYSGGLSMYMQPVVDLRDGAFGKVEALARLVRPDGEIVSPDRFLPVLSGADLNWLFREGLDLSLGHIARWDREGLAIDLSLNISPVTLLEPDCPAWVATSLERHGILPSRLSLEILENRALDRPEQREAIAKLVAAGVRISMDDLGAGYSSLQRLSSLPFDKIKVDQSLLAHIRSLPLETLGILGTIIQMGRELGYGVVVEGLEDEGMIEAAAILGARYGQGYSLARPMPAEKIAAWSTARHSPVPTRTIKSWLGALASHWHFMHNEEAARLLPLSHCPLTLFFQEKKLEGSPQASWHASLHERSEDRGNLGQRLTDWLVEKVREEGRRERGAEQPRE